MASTKPESRDQVLRMEARGTYRIPIVMKSWYEATTPPRISRGAHSPWYMGTPTERPPADQPNPCSVQSRSISLKRNGLPTPQPATNRPIIMCTQLCIAVIWRTLPMMNRPTKKVRLRRRPSQSEVLLINTAFSSWRTHGMAWTY